MGVETVAIVDCTLPDARKHEALPQFIERASAELREFDQWECSVRGIASSGKISGYWCVAGDTVEQVLLRDGGVGFELSVSVHGDLGRCAAEMWTMMRERLFLYEPQCQQLLRRLARQFARVMGASKALYVPDNRTVLSTASAMVTEGKSFAEIVAFANTIAPPLPAPRIEGIDFSLEYPDVDTLYFIDDFNDENTWPA